MPLYVPALWIACGVCLFSGIQFVLVSTSDGKNQLYTAFGCLCLLLAGYLLLTATLYQTHSVIWGIWLVRAQVALTCGIYPAAIGFFGLYANLVHWHRWFLLAAAIFGAAFIINLFSPASVLYSSISATAPLLLPWGESVRLFKGTDSPFASTYYLAVGACFIWAVGCCVVLWRRGQRQRMWPLALYLVIQIITFEHAEYVYRTDQRSITFEALAFLALVLIMSDVLRRELRRQTGALGASLKRLRIETDRRELVEEDLRHVAYHHRLTGLPNRLHMQNDLHAALAAQTFDHDALVLLNLDHFKTINDALGHAVGDEVLRSTAARVVAAVPAETQVAHFGSDEFALLLRSVGDSTESAAENAKQLALRVMACVAAPLRLGDHELVIGSSAGIVMLPSTAGDVSSVLREADVALHHAKAAGRNTAIVFESAMQASIEQRHSLVSDLRLALQRDEFEVYYQPQVDMHGRFVGAEALLRWQHPVRGLIEPIEFIPVAEEAGLIHAIGREVLHRACIERSAWPAATAHARLAVNVSPWQLFAQDFVNALLETARSTDVNPAHITLEITESIYLQDLDDIANKIRALAAHGFQFSMDDFGTGYTTLASLKKLPVSELKIDRVFVEGLQPGSHDGFVDAMIAIAHHLDLVVVAEGVETETQLTALRAMGCDVTQGYLVSRPLTAVAFREWLTANLAQNQASGKLLNGSC